MSAGCATAKPWGKARRLAEHLNAVAGPALAEQITAGTSLPPVSAGTAERSAWVRHVIAGMDGLLPEEQRREVMARRRCRWARGRPSIACCAARHRTFRRARVTVLSTVADEQSEGVRPGDPGLAWLRRSAWRQGRRDVRAGVGRPPAERA